MNIRTIRLADLYPTERAALVRRSPVPDKDVRRQAAEIVDSVRREGEAAVHEANHRFGGGLPMQRFAVSDTDLKSALESLPQELLTALHQAAAHIKTCHEAQRPVDTTVDVAPGVTVTRRWSPLRRVGVYVPGGKAAYPSSLLMAVIPAIVAGVEQIAVISPADDDGEVSEAVLGAAALLGIEEFYVAGGAQAIGALAYGTEHVEPVQKIVGPGNAWVTAAKLAVFGDVAVDLPAGPSEALVLADATADPRIIAADMMCQAEHGPDSPIVLVTTEPGLVPPVMDQLERLVHGLTREGVILTALVEHGLIAIAGSIDEAVQFANDFAPEHLTLHTDDPARDAARIPSAGSVFLGPWAPESAGDYATGANHILPTGGLAAAYGPLSLDDFGSWRQEQHLTKEGLSTLRPIITALADAEGLGAHRLSVDVRFEDEEDG